MDKHNPDKNGNVYLDPDSFSVAGVGASWGVSGVSWSNSVSGWNNSGTIGFGTAGVQQPSGFVAEETIKKVKKKFRSIDDPWESN